jgi:formylglycine-generating enzyme required for sulfatase activity
MAETGSDKVDRSKLLEAMTETFGEGDLRTLCFELGLDYDDLPAGGRSDKARDLILLCERTGRLDELLTLCRQKRPHIDWGFQNEPAVPAQAPQPAPQEGPSHIFLSYSRKDSQMKVRLVQDLQQASFSVWTDDGLEPGTPSWHQAIEDAIEAAGCLVVLLSPDAKESVWVRREVDYGVNHQKRIFPVMIRGTRTDAIPITIIDAQYVDLRREYPESFIKLRDALRRHLGQVPSPAEPELEAVPTVAIITSKQARLISQAVKQVNVILSKDSDRNKSRFIYSKLYRKFGVRSYKQLPAGNFEEAMTWLTEWHDRLAEAGLPTPGTAVPSEDIAIPHIMTGAPPLNIEWCWVPAGRFTMGGEEYTDEEPFHSVDLAGFWLARYLVTNAQFRRFIEAGGYEESVWWSDAGRQWQQGATIERPRYWTSNKWNGDEQPVVGVSWFEAEAFARWTAEMTGKPVGLPSEAEWEKAARGIDGRSYPWGDSGPTRTLCNFDRNEAGTTPVGKYSPAGDGPYGNADMAGNVWEWTSSPYKPYPYEVDDGRENDTNLDSRVVRGGSFSVKQWYVRVSVRPDLVPSAQFDGVGFRLVAHVVSGS